MLQRISPVRILAVVWLVVISILFFLPGSALPQNGLFGIRHFDKFVHVGFFALLVFLWRFFFEREPGFSWYLLALAFCYGFGVELVQHYFIANRSFDAGDLFADMAGAVVGLYYWTGRYIKK